MSLKTDYKDDILAVGNLRKYQMIQNNDGTVSFQDVTQYEQTGDVFGAGDINRTNQAVNEKFDSDDVVDPMLATEEGFAADAYQTKLQFDEQNKNLSNIKTYVGSDGKLHFVDSAGADSVLPFSNKNVENLICNTFGIVRNNTYKIAALANLNADDKYIICFSHNRRTASSTAGWNGNASVSTNGTIKTITNGQTNKNGYYVYMGAFIISNATYISITTPTTGDESDCTVFGFKI